MERFVLTDEQWAKMEPHCLGRPTDPGRSSGNNRLFMEAVRRCCELSGRGANGATVLLPGNRYDAVGVAPLIEGIDFDALLGDKTFDAIWFVQELNQRGAKVVISQRPKRLSPLAIDNEMYK